MEALFLSGGEKRRQEVNQALGQVSTLGIMDSDDFEPSIRVANGGLERKLETKPDDGGNTVIWVPVRSESDWDPYP